MSIESKSPKGQFTQFQGQRPKTRFTRIASAGKVFVDYKDTESLRRLMTNNGKLHSRKRTGATAMEQRMLARAVKRARYMALLPYIQTTI